MKKQVLITIIALALLGAAVWVYVEGTKLQDEKQQIWSDFYKDINRWSETIEFSEIDPPNVQRLPYIYDDPNFIGSALQVNTVCTKHGRLNWGQVVSFFSSDRRYCSRCITEIIEGHCDDFIGIDPNE